MENLQQEQQLAIKLAIDGGTIVTGALDSANRDPVSRRWSPTRRTVFKTGIDVAVDRMVRKKIAHAFPADAILSEESDFRKGTSGRVWVVDSIDGTLNLQGPLFGMFGVCVALAIGNTPVLGIVYSPIMWRVPRGKLWIGEIGKPTLYSSDYPGFEPAPVRVSDCRIRNHAIGGCDGGKHNRLAAHPYRAKLEHDTQGVTCVYNIGCASMALMGVATGEWDFYCATSLEPEDMAAAVPILQGAEAVVTTLDGRPWTIKEPSILTANPLLHGDLLQYLNS